MSLKTQIEKTSKVLKENLNVDESFSISLHNQYEIMLALNEIQNELRRVKKSYPSPGFGPA